MGEISENVLPSEAQQFLHTKIQSKSIRQEPAAGEPILPPSSCPVCPLRHATHMTTFCSAQSVYLSARLKSVFHCRLCPLLPLLVSPVMKSNKVRWGRGGYKWQHPKSERSSETLGRLRSGIEHVQFRAESVPG